MHILMRGRTDQWLRLASGLILFAFVLTHFANHALGLISIGAMDWFQTLRWGVTRSLPGKIILVSAILIHIALAFVKLAQRTTWRMPTWEGVQIGSGLLIPLFLIPHVVTNRFAAELFNTNDYYLYALILMWPDQAIKTAILMTLVWVHACIGLHFWLRLSPVYERFQGVVYTTAVAIPLLSYTGFPVAARAAETRAAAPGALARIMKQLRFPDQAGFETLGAIAQWMQIGFAVLLGLLVAQYVYRRVLRRSRERLAVSYVHGPDVRAVPGPTLLEISRQNNVPHTSVCGGRARCSTCRVRIDQGLALLHPPEAAERRTLKSIDAGPNVRLACQIKPKSPLTVFRLVPNAHGNTIAHMVAAQTEEETGVERELVIMFMDVRGFTRWSEGKLPYDVVFILNEFFATASRIVCDEGGWIDKYMGDGMMAVFGRDCPPEEAARQALRASARIDADLDALAERLAPEIGETVRVGIGLHAGNVVLGKIGYAHAGTLTVIGEAVNTASRLESLTSEMGLQLILSNRVAELSGITLAPDAQTETEIRGLQKPVAIFGFKQARDIRATQPSA